VFRRPVRRLQQIHFKLHHIILASDLLYPTPHEVEAAGGSCSSAQARASMSHQRLGRKPRPSAMSGERKRRRWLELGSGSAVSRKRVLMGDIW